MEIVELNQALAQIKQLLERASNGQEIIIVRNEQPMVKLVPPESEVSRKRPPLFGSDKDVIYISDDFDAPLDEFEDY